MEMFIENIQLLCIINRQAENILYEQVIKDLITCKITNLEDVLPGKLINSLKKSNIVLNGDMQLSEADARQLPNLFKHPDMEKHEHEQIKELLFQLIKFVGINISERFIINLKQNVEKYSESEEFINVSFTSLYLLLFYFYKIKYNENKPKLDNKLQALREKEENESSESLVDDETKAFKYLRNFLSHSKFSFAAHKLCHHLNVGLNLPEMLDFCTSLNTSQYKNLFLFIGNTGDAKSTLINYLTGTEYALDEDEDGLEPINGTFNKLKVSDDYNDSDNERHLSETLFCEVLKLDSDGVELNLCDTPGYFDNNQNENKSIVASLGLPMLLDKTDCVKAIVIVMEFSKFSIKAGNRGEQFVKTNKSLLQMFKDFKPNDNSIQILFAITKCNDKNKTQALKYIENNLKNFKATLNTTDKKREIKTNEDTIIFLGDKIKLLNSYKDNLKKAEQTKIGIINKLTHLLRYKDDRVKEDKEVKAEELMSLETKLENEFKTANENKELIPLQLEVWEHVIQDANKEKQECEKIKLEYEASNLMIQLIEKTLSEK